MAIFLDNATESRRLEDFYHATSARNSTGIEKVGGRVSLIDGDMFYSPNCSRIVARPPNTFNSIFNPRTEDVTVVHQPLWWSMEYTHLAFMPLYDIRSSPFRSSLGTSSWSDPFWTQFTIDSAVTLSWNHVESNLRSMTRLLANRGRISSLQDVITTAIVSREPHEDKGVISRAKNWFLYWFGQLAYAIAVNISIDNDPIHPSYELPFGQPQSLSQQERDQFMSLAVPQWFIYLGVHRWPQSLLSAVLTSVANFEKAIPRVGIFLNILHPSRLQFSVDWFTQFNVPVWYPWTRDEARSIHPWVSYLAPLPHQLQEVATFLTKSPDWVNPLDPQPWFTFFEMQADINESMRLRETEEEWGLRVAKEREPPANAKVFEWLKNEGGVYERTSVTGKKRKRETLRSYGRKEKFYDPFFNEWDCVGEMGRLDREEIEGRPTVDEEVPLPHVIGIGNHDDSKAQYPEPLVNTKPSSLIPEHLLPPAELTTFEPVHVMHEYYGFVPPLPIIQNQPECLPDEAKRLKYTKLIGLNEIYDDYFNSPIASHAIEFLDSLVGCSSTTTIGLPQMELWDLAQGNRMGLGGNKRLKTMKRIGPLFCFSKASNATWMLGVDRADIALLVCRLDDTLDARGLSLALLQRGIAHHTLITLSSSPSYRPPSPPLPIRLPGYQFSAADYAAYANQVTRLLRMPRVSRAALMSGGIVWRLALNESFATVLAGPTAALEKTRLGISFQSEHSSFRLWDDICTDRELDILCGANICFNGTPRTNRGQLL